MKGVSVKNKLIAMFIATFSFLESAMLDIILRFFIRNIDDYEIRKKTTRSMIITN